MSWFFSAFYERLHAMKNAENKSKITKLVCRRRVALVDNLFSLTYQGMCSRLTLALEEVHFDVHNFVDLLVASGQLVEYLDSTHFRMNQHE